MENQVRMVFVIQHNPSPAQVAEAQKALFCASFVAMTSAPDPTKGSDKPTEGVLYLGKQSLLNVPDKTDIGRDWFVKQALAIEAAFGGFTGTDLVHAMGQPQLMNAINALARGRGALLFESVTRRESVDTKQSDGTVKKTSVFVFNGYRTVYEF